MWWRVPARRAWSRSENRAFQAVCRRSNSSPAASERTHLRSQPRAEARKQRAHAGTQLELGHVHKAVRCEYQGGLTCYERESSATVEGSDMSFCHGSADLCSSEQIHRGAGCGLRVFLG